MATVGSFQMECIKVNGKPVSQLKVEELKTELELRGLKKSGVKKELQDRLCEYLEKGGNNTEDSDIQSSPTVSISFSTQKAPSITKETSDQNNSQELEPEIQGKSKDQNEEDENEQDQVEENHNKKGPNKKDQESKPTGLDSNKSKAELEDGEIAVPDESKKDSQKTRSETQPEKKRRISLTRQTSKTAHTPGSRKRKWSSTVNKNKSSVVISTDSLKGLIPGVQLASTPALEAVMDFGDDKEDEEMVAEKQEEEEEEKENEPAEDNISDGKEDEKTPNKKTRVVHVEESKKLKLNQSVEAQSNETDVNPNVQEISNQDMPTGEVTRDEDLPSSSTTSSETNFKANRAVSPPRNQPSQVIHVAHLVRPFTQNQLNQLLSQFGSLVEGGFWINKIKSHCYVTYSSVDDAKIARDSLHGQRWPNTSPRILNVDFGDDEQMLEDTDGALGKKKEVTDKIEKENENEKEKKKEKGKETRRHKERKESKPKQEPSPANLLDKLFRKTTTVPFIYWLPLTKEQILIKENERDERRKQRQLALQEEEKQGNERLGREKERDWGREKPRDTEREKERDTGREKERDTEREKERDTEREKERDTEREKERDTEREKERDTEREKERDTEREKERETSRPKERKPLRDNRALSPPSKPRSDRRSAEFKNRSRSRSKGLSTRRDDQRRR